MSTESWRPTATPRLSIHLRNFAEHDAPLDHVVRSAETADAAGIDRVLVSDHVLLGERLDAYGRPELGGATGRSQPTGPDGQWLEPLTVLSVVAGRTRRIRLGTAVLLAALRTPAVLAKQLSTLDVLSAGRLDVGVGVGWQREEYEACGLDFERRGELLDQCLSICSALWSGDPVSETWSGHRFDRVRQRPRPAQDPSIPIWVSGRLNGPVVRRLVAHGHGWIPWGEYEEDPRQGIDVLRSAFADNGRDPEKLRVQARIGVPTDDHNHLDVDSFLASAKRLVQGGVTDLLLSRAWGIDSASEAELMQEIVAAVHAEFRS